MTKVITVLIVEDHRLMVEGLEDLIAEVPELKVVGTAGSVLAAVDAARELQPQVVLMDFRLPDGDGVQATRLIRKQSPKIAVVFLTAVGDDDVRMSAADAGASAYLLKSATAQEMREAIIRAAGEPLT